MKSRRENLEREAKTLMGMSGLLVYEVRKHANPKAWYYAIVWRGRELCTVRMPWDANKGKLQQVGRTIRYGLAQEELDEINNGEQKLADDDAKIFQDFERETEKDAVGMVKRDKGLGREFIYS